MAVAFRSAGALVAFPDELTLDVPAGTADGDIMLAVFNSDIGGDVANATGWTQALTGDSHINLRLTLLWRRAGGSEPANYTFNLTGSTAMGRLLSFSGCVASGDPIGASGATNDTAASATATALTITPPSDNNGVVFAVISTDATTIRTCSGYSGTGPTFTEAVDSGASSVNSDSLAVAFGVQATAAATGSRTATLSGVPIENMAVLVALKPFVAAGGAPRGFRDPEEGWRR